MSDKARVLANVVEVVTEPELDSVLEKANPSAYCGYETSGQVHIGHMVTATKLLDLDAAGFDVKILFADLHTMLNRKGAKDWIDEMVEYWKVCFKAMGLEKAKYVRGSDFQLEREYIEDVLSISLSTTMKRALRSMQEVARDVSNARVSQMIYPLMQIVDIKALDVDIAYGGLEQRKIHMLARETLPQIGFRKPVCLHTPLLCALTGPGSKMSSSIPNSLISIDESEKSIKKKVNSAYCPQTMAENPVFDIAKLLIFPRTDRIEVFRPEKFGGNISYPSIESLGEDLEAGKLHPADLKNAVGTHLAEILAPIRESIKDSGIELPKL